MSQETTGNVLELVVQLASLQKSLTPALPAISQKLIGDLLSTGVPARSIAKVIKRSPSYVLTFVKAKRSLTAQGVVDVVKFAAAEAKRKAKEDAAQD